MVSDTSKGGTADSGPAIDGRHRPYYGHIVVGKPVVRSSVPVYRRPQDGSRATKRTTPVRTPDEQYLKRCSSGPGSANTANSFGSSRVNAADTEARPNTSIKW